MPKKSLKKLSFPARTAIALGVSVLLAFLACLLLAAVAMASEDPTAHLSIYGNAVFLLSMLFCGFFGARLAAENRFLCGLIAAGCLLLFAIAMHFALGEIGFAKAFALAALGAFCGALGALLGAREKKRKRKR